MRSRANLDITATGQSHAAGDTRARKAVVLAVEMTPGEDHANPNLRVLSGLVSR